MEMHALMIVGEEETAIKFLYLVLMKNHLGNHKYCRMLIRHQRVTVNHQIMRDPYYQVLPNDVIEVDRCVIHSMPFVYYMMNKPHGYICANHDKHHHCLTELIEEEDCYCVGRLDKDTTGLILLTNDSSLSKKLLLPQNHVEKIYEVTTRNPLVEGLIECFQKGVIIDHHQKCLPSLLTILDDYHAHVTLREGKYHQVKKMFLSLDNEVVALKRIAFADIMLDPSLKEGEYRSLTQEEMKVLFSHL